MLGEFERALSASGFDEADAAALARVFADNTCDGVASHGINRFPAFVGDVRGGRLAPAARAERVAALGALEQWDGHRGPGILSALACMDRAVELAREHAVGAVALRNTSHWMRAGTYGLRAAAAGCIGICWTNTTRLMPPHGSAEKRLGEQPPGDGGAGARRRPRAPRHGDEPVLRRARADPRAQRRAPARARRLRRRGPADHRRRRPGAPPSHRPLEGQRPGSLPGPGGGPGLRGPHHGGDLAGAEGDGGVADVPGHRSARRPAIPDRVRQAVEESLADLASADSLPGERVAWPGQRSAERRREALRLGVPVEQRFWEEVLAL